MSKRDRNILIGLITISWILMMVFLYILNIPETEWPTTRNVIVVLTSSFLGLSLIWIIQDYNKQMQLKGSYLGKTLKLEETQLGYKATFKVNSIRESRLVGTLLVLLPSNATLININRTAITSKGGYSLGSGFNIVYKLGNLTREVVCDWPLNYQRLQLEITEIQTVNESNT